MRISDWSSDVCSSDLRQHHLEVDGGGGVHARLLGLHVGGQPGEVLLELGQRGSDVDIGRRSGRAGWRQREQTEAEAADRREVAAGGGRVTGVREAWPLVTAPEAVELAARHEDRRHRRHRFADRTSGAWDSGCPYGYVS